MTNEYPPIAEPSIEFVVTRPHQDKDGNHRRVGEKLMLTEFEAEPFRKRGQLMTPAEWEAEAIAERERDKNATYEFHHYERP